MCVCVYIYIYIYIYAYMCVSVCVCVCVCVCVFVCIYISGGPLSALTCCVNVRLLSAIKKISPLIYSQSWVGSWVYTTHYDDFHPDILARMYT